MDLLIDVARSRPDLQVAVVGPDSLGQASHDALAAEPSVHLLGPVPYGRVPAFLQHADVVIVPHQVNAFTESLDPIKAYECVAAGRPTVATPVAGFRDLGAPVVVADRETFVAEVARVLDEPGADPADGSPPVPVASWHERAASMLEVMRRVRTARTPS